MEQMRRNLKKVICLAATVLSILTVRLFWIQIIGGEELDQAACEQSMVALEGINTRGLICDRNGTPLVAEQKRFFYIIHKKDLDYQAAKLLTAIGARQNESSGDYYVYSSQRYRKEVGIKLVERYHAYILQAPSRYGEHQTAAGFIGYVNQSDSTGAAGLELMCDRQLSKGNHCLYAVADVQGNLLPGRGLVTGRKHVGHSGRKGDVRTTLEKSLQNSVEHIIAEYGEDCAVVVLKQDSGDVLAIACSPTFNPNEVSEHLSSHREELFNKATQGEYAPGSVFKIVVAAAALEEGIPCSRSFCCTGSVKLGTVEIRCKTGGESGHGEISMKEAFAQSCNSYFIQLAQETGAERICTMAKKMGLGRKVLDRYPQQCMGHVMDRAECSGAGVGNLAIGQGQMLVTPLQVARMTEIIANGGIDQGVHVLLSENTQDRRVLRRETAEQIRAMMCRVTETGTAKTMGLTRSDGSAAAAVKTGTAQYGERDSGNSYGWLTGFLPCEQPEYIVTVFAGGEHSTASDAGRLYRRIVSCLKYEF